MTAPQEDQLLTPALRAKMIALASQGLAQMPAAQVPGPLRKSITFAPARRVKLVGNLITQSVDGDDDFRVHLATQVRALVREVIEALERGEAPDEESLADAAAAAYIIRPDGWAGVVDRACQAEQSRRGGAADTDMGAMVSRLQLDVDSARDELRVVRERLRSQLDSVKADNVALRRTLGQTRVQLKEAQTAAEQTGTALDVVRREGEAAARAADAEARRLRQRIDQLESVSASSRRAARDDRDGENTRLRLLLDTVMESAAGLRRELGLPAGELLPADTVPAVDPGVASLTAGVGRALLNDDPALLRRLLEVPRSHLVIDGYNVSKTAWSSLPLDQQRVRLANGVAALVTGKGVETTIVFDGADLIHPPPVTAPRAIRVRFSPPGVIADDLIRQLVSAEPAGRPVIVVSTDREVAESVAKMGARSVASMALVKAMGL